MAANVSDLRRLIVTALRGSPPVSAIVEDRANGPALQIAPDWPFAYVELPLITAEPMSCAARAYRASLVVHSYAKGDDESVVAALARAVEDTLDGFSGDLRAGEPDRLSDLMWTQTQVLRDTAEEKGWHGVSRFEGIVAG